MKEIKYETIRYPWKVANGPAFSDCNDLWKEIVNPEKSTGWGEFDWYFIKLASPIKDNKALCLLSWVFVVFLIILVIFYFVLKKKWKIKKNTKSK